MLATASPPVRAQAPLSIAAVVNEDVITLRELQERLAFAIVASGLPDTPETRSQLVGQVLRNLIDETLQLQEARRLGLRVAPQEIAQAAREVARRNGMSLEELETFLASRGISRAALERQLEAQLAWARVVEQQIRPRVVVGRQQIELAVATLGRRDASEVRLFEILLPVYAPEEEPEVMAQARELVRALRNGADFRALAQQVSAAASAEVGGDLGWLPLSGLVASVQQVVAGLAPGAVSDPVRTPRGIQIFMVAERRTVAADDPRAEEVVELAQLVIPLSADADAARREDALLRAQRFRREIRDCADIVRFARELAAPASGRLGWLVIDELPAPFADLVRTMRPGEVSPPVPGPLGIHILGVCRRGGEEGLRELVRIRLERQQIERLAARYLRDLRMNAFIDVRI